MCRFLRACSSSSSESDVLILYRLIAFLTLFVALLGVAEFITQHRLAIDLIPKSLLAKMMEDNPSVAIMVNSDPFRNGFYRASSIYNVPLSFGEFAAMTAPIGGYFLLHGDKWRDRVLGVAVVVAAMLGLFVSGSRGGSVGFLVAMPVLGGSMGRPIFADAPPEPGRRDRRDRDAARNSGDDRAGVPLGTSARHRARRRRRGREHDARFDQWRLAWPHILDNPITGHGVGNAAVLVGYTPGGFLTLDSYVLTLLVETGIPGLLFFAGIILFAMWACARIYLRDLDKRAALGGPLACSFLAFGVYRLALSQRENQTLFFLLVGLTFIFVKLASERAGPKDKVAVSRRNR